MTPWIVALVLVVVALAYIAWPWPRGFYGVPKPPFPIPPPPAATASEPSEEPALLDEAAKRRLRGRLAAMEIDPFDLLFEMYQMASAESERIERVRARLEDNLEELGEILDGMGDFLRGDWEEEA